jgi:hypothetical protein
VDDAPPNPLKKPPPELPPNMDPEDEAPPEKGELVEDDVVPPKALELPPNAPAEEVTPNGVDVELPPNGVLPVLVFPPKMLPEDLVPLPNGELAVLALPPKGELTVVFPPPKTLFEVELAPPNIDALALEGCETPPKTLPVVWVEEPPKMEAELDG